MHIWDSLLTDDDRAVIEKGHYGQPRGFGKKPLLLIIDLQPNYIGADKPIGEVLKKSFLCVMLQENVIYRFSIQETYKMQRIFLIALQQKQKEIRQNILMALLKQIFWIA